PITTHPLLELTVLLLGLDLLLELEALRAELFELRTVLRVPAMLPLGLRVDFVVVRLKPGELLHHLVEVPLTISHCIRHLRLLLWYVVLRTCQPPKVKLVEQ